MDLSSKISALSALEMERGDLELEKEYPEYQPACRTYKTPFFFLHLSLL